MVTSLGCVAITAAHTIIIEYLVADHDAREGHEPGSRGPFNATGLAIDVAIIVFGLVLVICACFASCLNCCCDSRPPKVIHPLCWRKWDRLHICIVLLVSDTFHFFFLFRWIVCKIFRQFCEVFKGNYSTTCKRERSHFVFPQCK